MFLIVREIPSGNVANSEDKPDIMAKYDVDKKFLFKIRVRAIFRKSKKDLFYGKNSMMLIHPNKVI